jgi:hypothetical protein
MYTLLFNIPIGALAVFLAIKAGDNDCNMFIPTTAWGIVLAACCLYFILFAIRIYITLAKPYTASVDSMAKVEEGIAHQPAGDKCARPPEVTYPYRIPCRCHPRNRVTRRCQPSHGIT